MQIILATSNKGKVKEIRDFYQNYEILPFTEFLEPFEINENGLTFQENAIIKAQTIWDKMQNLSLKQNFVVLSDDSGISVEALNFEPGIYSARYSGKDATDASNRAKLIQNLKSRNLTSSRAFYTACIAICSKFGLYTTHGFMHGVAVDYEKGENGFGYDFLFIPDGFDKTIAQLELSKKLEISHRSKALENAKFILNLIEKRAKNG